MPAPFRADVPQILGLGRMLKLSLEQRSAAKHHPLSKAAMDENNNSRNLHFVVSFLMNKEAKKTKPTPKAG